MSIAPFLPGLPVPAAPDGSTTPDSSGGDPGSAFGDALAAALAGTLGVAPAVTPAAATPTPSPADLGVPSADLGVPSADLGVRSADLGVRSADLGIPSADLGVPSADLGVPSAELGIPSADLGVPSAESGVRSAESGVAEVAPRRTTEAPAISASALRSVLAPGDPEVGLVTGVSGTTFPTPGSTERSPDSIDGTNKSTAETPNSAVATPNSTSGIPNSAVATPNSAGGIPNSAVAKAVVQQVFPEVTRIVSTVGAPGGPVNGTHRITLTLQPEQLGEVRVTLVVRDGSVHVRLAGGTGGVEGADAAAVHRALASGAPELQRILERTGAEARVTVRDPFAPLPPTTPATSSAQAEGHARSDTQARQEQAAREQPRDQPREQPRRREPQRASYPAATTPVAGRLDRTV